MVVNDFPALLGLPQNERELAGGIAAAGLRTGEEELAKDESVIVAEGAGFDDFEAKLAHGLGRAVGLFVPGEDVGVAAVEGFAKEGDLRRVFIGGRERIKIAAIPGSRLFRQHGSDGRILAAQRQS